MEKKTVGIIGASGYTGYELVKILARHPLVELKVLNSGSCKGKKVKEVYPEFKGDEAYTDYSPDEINGMGLDCMFLAVPSTAAFEIVPKLKCSRIIDLSADYRFKRIERYEETYKVKHSDEKGNKKAVYGLPELFKEKIKKAKLIANPGCYATVCLLAVYPLVKERLANYIVFDCKSGYSGAGKESEYAKNPEIIKDNIVAYKLTSHRHKPEIEQFIKAKLSFTPHVINAFQGMMCTAHILLKKEKNKAGRKGKENEREGTTKGTTGEMVVKLFKDFYKHEAFVKVVDKIPEIKDVAKTNYCRIGGFEIDGNNQLVIVAVIDNLIKGASGQAVQNMNIMFGFKEEEGLL